MDSIRIRNKTEKKTKAVKRKIFIIRMAVILQVSWVVIIMCCGCGTTKWSDTSRTATEQMLISSAIEDVIDEFDFYPLSGRKIYLKKDGVNCQDNQYLFSILRQQLAANGVFIKDKEDDADYILEIAPGAVGTNRYDLMYGISSTSIPSSITGGTVTSIPEISLVKRTDQKAEVKLLLWAYNRKTGSIIWQSGTKSKTAFIRNRWFFGIGPITKTSYDPKKIAVGGDEVKVPGRSSWMKNGEYIANDEKPSVKTEAVYREIDQKSLDRLQSIREKGTFNFTQDEEKEKAEKKTESPGTDNKKLEEDSKKTKEEKKSGEEKKADPPKEKPKDPPNKLTAIETVNENQIKQVSAVKSVNTENKSVTYNDTNSKVDNSSNTNTSDNSANTTSEVNVKTTNNTVNVTDVNNNGAINTATAVSTMGTNSNNSVYNNSTKTTNAANTANTVNTANTTGPTGTTIENKTTITDINNQTTVLSTVLSGQRSSTFPSQNVPVLEFDTMQLQLQSTYLPENQ